MRKWLGFTFSTGAYTGEDYREFEREYRKKLRNIAKKNGFELVRFMPNHYEFSCFFRNHQGEYVYMSISDVRYWGNEWYDRILIRSAESDHDYTGGSNRYTNYDKLGQSISNAFGGA